MVDRPESLLNRREVLRIGAVGAGGLVAQSLVAPAARADSGSASMIEVAGQPLDVPPVGGEHLENPARVGSLATADLVQFLLVRGLGGPLIQRLLGLPPLAYRLFESLFRLTALAAESGQQFAEFVLVPFLEAAHARLLSL